MNQHNLRKWENKTNEQKLPSMHVYAFPYTYF